MTKDFKTLIDEATEKLAKDSSFHANVNSKVIVQSIFHDGASLPNELLIKTLEALEAISVDFGTDYCDGNCLNAYETLTEIRQRLEEAGK